MLATGGIVALTDLSFWIAAPGLWVLSFAFGTLAAARYVQPRLVALALAATGLVIGSFQFMNVSERFGAIAAVISAAVIVTYALYDRSWPLVALGVIAFFIATMSLMSTVLQGTVSRLITVALGLVLVAAVVIRAQRTGHTRPQVREKSTGQGYHEPPEDLGHSPGATATPPDRSDCSLTGRATRPAARIAANLDRETTGGRGQPDTVDRPPGNGRRPAANVHNCAALSARSGSPAPRSRSSRTVTTRRSSRWERCIPPWVVPFPSGRAEPILPAGSVVGWMAIAGWCSRAIRRVVCGGGGAQVVDGVLR